MGDVNLEKVADRFDGPNRAALFRQASDSVSSERSLEWLLTEIILRKAVEKAIDSDPAVPPEALSLAVEILRRKPELGLKGTLKKAERLLARLESSGKIDAALLGDVRVGVGLPREMLKEEPPIPTGIRDAKSEAQIASPILKPRVPIAAEELPPVDSRAGRTVIPLAPARKLPSKSPSPRVGNASSIEEIDSKTKSDIDAAMETISRMGTRANLEISKILETAAMRSGIAWYALARSLEGLLGDSTDKESFGWLVMKISELKQATTSDNFNAVTRGLAHEDETVRYYSVLAANRMLNNNWCLATREALEKAVFLFKDSNELVQSGARELARLAEAGLQRKGETVTIPQILEEQKRQARINNLPLRRKVTQRSFGNAAMKAIAVPT